MKHAIVGAGFAFTLVVVAYAGGQDKKQLPALAYDATIIKVEEKKGIPTKLYYVTSPEDKKKLGIGEDNVPVTKNTKFVYVGADGEKKFNQKSVLADKDAKEHLQKDKKIRIQVTAIEVEELRFGPELKPQGPKRVR